MSHVRVFIAIMQCRVFVVAVFLLFVKGNVVLADGLVFQLPPDGAWARYNVQTDGEFQLPEGPDQKLAIVGTLTISSVGELTRNEQKCRWIELKSESKAEGIYPKMVLKMLIPEDRLRRGEDPLAHAVQTFFNPKPIDKAKAPSVESFIDEGFNRVQYEIDRFRDVFPKPLDNPKNLQRETAESSAGKFEDCEVLTGTSDCDGPLLNHGRGVFKANYRLVLHPKAPFGVVSMQIESDGREFSSAGAVSVKLKRTLTLAETGKNATSDLPSTKIEK
jgi:hypothetical protein